MSLQEMSVHLQNIYRQSMLERVWGKMSPPILLVMMIGITALENIMEVPAQIKLQLPCVLSCSFMSDLFQSLWYVTHRLLCPWGFSSQVYLGGLSCPLSRDLPHLGSETRPMLGNFSSRVTVGSLS